MCRFLHLIFFYIFLEVPYGFYVYTLCRIYGCEDIVQTIFDKFCRWGSYLSFRDNPYQEACSNILHDLFYERDFIHMEHMVFSIFKRQSVHPSAWQWSCSKSLNVYNMPQLADYLNSTLTRSCRKLEITNIKGYL